MTQESGAEVLKGVLGDHEVAERVAGGDFGDFAEADLTESERALITAAAAEIAEDDVAGFADFLKIGDIKGESKEYYKYELKNLTSYPKVELAMRTFKF